MTKRTQNKTPLTVYFQRKFLILVALGFSSGLPFALTGGTLFIWLREAGVDLQSIGLFAALGLPYALKFLWSPIVDQVSLPFFTKTFGRRRGWILFSQILLVASIVGLGATTPSLGAGQTAVMALLVAFFSATQDIVIDAFRVEKLDQREQAAGAASLVFGYRLGMLASGAGALYLATGSNWAMTYAAMAALILIGSLAVLVSREPEQSTRVLEEGHPKNFAHWIKGAVIDPFADFLTRKGWFLILLFIAFYKFGDALAVIMGNPFLIDLGFSKIEIANVAKVFGFGATLAGLGLGGWLLAKAGLFRSLLVCGLVQMASIFLYVVQAKMGHDVTVLAFTIGGENLASGMGTAVFVAYLSMLCNVRFTATQYALFSSLFAFSRSLLSSGSGTLAEHVGWVPYFLITMAAAIPGILLLFLLRILDRRETKRQVF